LHNYEHKKLTQAIAKLDEVPLDPAAYSEWIKAEAHLSFLRQNAKDGELIVYAAGEYSFINAVVVANNRLMPINKEDLMAWSLNPYRSIASYVWGGERDDVWIERGLSGTGTTTLEDALQLISGRTFEGWSGPGRNYFELHQEYAHLAGIHWRPESRAYCRFNDNGDLDPLVSITTREDKGSNVTLVSFKWEPLEEYLTASNTSVVRMFDFTLLQRSEEFSGWSDGEAEEFQEADHFFYKQRVMPGYAAYTRGVQIIRPRRNKKVIFTGMKQGWSSQKDKKYVEYTAHDWRNKQIRTISTDPSATTNYFDAKDNSLPFELSPAFFRPEVLLKYKADRDKYTVSERDISCRAAWHLQGIDVNEAGQVHAYICDLRQLPYAEQLHWLSFNEPPKASISKRAAVNDFEGQFVSFMEPLRKVLLIVSRWHDEKAPWWILREDRLLERVNTPLTRSRDEWADAFMDLAKLVIEGFDTKPIRQKLDAVLVPYDNKDQTIALLEKLLNKGKTSGDIERLDGLRTVQSLRTKLKGHVGGSEADQLAHEALMNHETYANHFRHVCTQVSDELELIQKVFS
jgi:hypothetical protein